MEVSYDADVDILSIILVRKKVKESQEVLPGVVVDFDSSDQVIAFEIFDAGKFTDLSKVSVALHQATKSKASALPEQVSGSSVSVQSNPQEATI